LAAGSGSSDGAPVAILAGTIGGMVILFVLTLGATLLSEMAVLRVELTDDFTEGLNYHAIFAMVKLVFPQLLLGSILIWLVMIALSFVGMLACCVGIFPATVVGFMLQAHFRGVLYEHYLSLGGEPIFVAEPVEGAFFDGGFAPPNDSPPLG
ncbi:MAG: DUF4013 domain-containing protein, partial [Myxococcales bacterium]|nr:DUF4013 domain-containing protein [Myxococcales bacterium]